MRIGFLSDIHVDYNSQYSVAEAVAEAAKNANIDALYIAGDISSDATLSLITIKKIEKLSGVPVHFVFGNHDYYRENFFDLRARHPQATVSTIPSVVADTGWYDYTWGVPSFKERYMRGKMPMSSGGWPDHRFIIDIDAEAFSKATVESLNKQAEAQDKVKGVVVHMIPHRDLASTLPQFQKTNVFFGGDELQKCIENIKPEFVVYGHTHFKEDKEIDGIRYICRPVGYAFEWLDNNIFKRVEDLLEVIEV